MVKRALFLHIVGGLLLGGLRKITVFSSMGEIRHATAAGTVYEAIPLLIEGVSLVLGLRKIIALSFFWRAFLYLDLGLRKITALSFIGGTFLFRGLRKVTDTCPFRGIRHAPVAGAVHEVIPLLIDGAFLFRGLRKITDACPFREIRHATAAGSFPGRFGKGGAVAAALAPLLFVAGTVCSGKCSPASVTGAVLLIGRRSQVAPGLEGSSEVVEGRCGNKACGGTGSAHEIAGACLGSADCMHSSVFHVADMSGLHGGRVGKDAGDETGGLLRNGIGRKQHHSLGEIVQCGIVRDKDQIGVKDHGHKNQQQPHDDDTAENAKSLDQKGDCPLLALAAAVQRTDRQYGRRDDVEQQYVEHPRYQREQDHKGVDQDRNAEHDGHEVVKARVADGKIAADDINGIDGVGVIKGLLTGIVGIAERVRKIRIDVVIAVVGRVQRAGEENDAVQRYLEQCCVFLLKLLQGAEGGVGPHNVQGMLK